jgi:hypothetical protein
LFSFPWFSSAHAGRQVRKIRRTLSVAEAEAASRQGARQFDKDSKNHASVIPEAERRNIWKDEKKGEASPVRKTRGSKKSPSASPTGDKAELLELRESRKVTGCACVGKGVICGGKACDCFVNGIMCSSEGESCGCSAKRCRNPLGRYAFDEKKVHGQVARTLRLKARVRRATKHAVLKSRALSKLSLGSPLKPNKLTRAGKKTPRRR